MGRLDLRESGRSLEASAVLVHVVVGLSLDSEFMVHVIHVEAIQIRPTEPSMPEDTEGARKVPIEL